MFSFTPYHSLIVTNLLSSSCYPAAVVAIISTSSANLIDVNNLSTPLHFSVSQFASVNVVVFISKCCSLQEVTLVFFHDIIVHVHNYLHKTMLPCMNIWENRNKEINAQIYVIYTNFSPPTPRPHFQNRFCISFSIFFIFYRCEINFPERHIGKTYIRRKG